MSNAKTREIKTKFSIEGEKQLKSALSENAAQAKELKSEMTLLDAKFADATDSEEYLAKKAEILAEQVQNAEDKVSLYQEALDKATKQQKAIADAVEASRKVIEQQEAALEEARKEFGAASEQAQRLNDELEYSKRVLANQENQLSKANKSVSDYRTSTNYAQTAVEKLTKAQEDNADGSEDMSDSLSDIVDKLGIDLPAGVQEALNAFGNMDKGMNTASVGLVAGIGLVIAALKQLVDMAGEGAEQVKELTKISQEFGLDTETVQRFQYAAEVMGMSVETILDAQKRVVEIQGEVIDGTEEYTKIMRQLGVSIHDTNGNLKDSETLMFELFEELGKMRNEQERAIIASKLLGDQFTQLTPVLNDGATSFRELMDEAERAGYVFGEESVRAIEEFNQAQKRLELQSDATKKRLMSTFSEIGTIILDAIRGIKSFDNALYQIKKSALGALGVPQGWGYASGTPSAAGGVATVGEYGPERVILPKGAQVMNARDTAAASGHTVYNTINISVPNLEELQRVIDFYENYEITKRMR